MAELPTGTVTFLFTDLEGSTQLWERQPEAMRAALGRHDRLLREAAEKHGGNVFKTGGDAFCVAFQSAPRALSAALEAQLALHAEDWGGAGPLRARAALHTGAADVRDGDYFGPALNRVARLLAIGHGGQTLLSHSSAELVHDALPENATLKDLGTHRLKDLQRPEQVFQLLHAGLPDEFPHLRSLDALPQNLPLQPNAFIGRERELTDLRRLLSSSRLLTLTGAGGSGKTRLALQLAAESLEGYPDGVWLIDLAALTDPALVPQTVATALAVREAPGRALTQTLAESLKPKKLLLLLDNCEHVVAACADLVATLMRSCPDITILTTSREVIGISGEVVWSIPALSTPDPRQMGPAASMGANLTQFEAVRLFIDRACMAKSDFAVTNQNATAVAQICHRLDGIPLALELAAGRVKALSPDQIAARLDDRFRLLTGGSRTALPRHQTLRAAIDWSYELLSEPERILLRRLSVFAGGWTLEAAESVCAGEGIEEWEVLDFLTHLIDKSLVLAETVPDGETRYRLLGTVRQYAGDRLIEAAEAAPLRTRHRDWFLALAEKAIPGLRGKDQGAWVERLEVEHDNMRAALEWTQAEEGGEEKALRLAGALYRFWYVRGHLTEGQQWLEAALARGSTAAAPLGRALRGVAILAMEQGDNQKATALFEQSLGLYRELGDKRGIARALAGLAMVALDHAEHGRAETLYTEVLGLAREIGATDIMASILNNLGETARMRGDYDAARKQYEEALPISGEGGPHLTSTILSNLGMVALVQGDLATARRCFEESLPMGVKLGYRTGIAGALEGLAELAVREGQLERAARLLGACEAMREAINVPVSPADLAEHDRAMTALRDALGGRRLAASSSEGRAMTQDQAIAFALSGLDQTTGDSASAAASEPHA
jgi:predicted ATPase/class 3 adenylate cyclase